MAQLSVAIGLLLSIFTLSNFVVGDPLSVLTLKNTKVTNYPNEYFDAVDHELLAGKKSPRINIKLPTKKELPPTMQVIIALKISGQDPFEHSMSLCDALANPMVSSSISRAGLPKGQFPKSCPFVAGDWSLSKWDVPVELIPPGIPDGPVSGSVTITNEDKPSFKVDFDGTLSHDIPLLGR